MKYEIGIFEIKCTIIMVSSCHQISFCHSSFLYIPPSLPMKFLSRESYRKMRRALTYHNWCLPRLDGHPFFGAAKCEW